MAAAKLLAGRDFRRRLLRWIRRALAVRTPAGLAAVFFRLPGGRRWGQYRRLAEANGRKTFLRMSPVPLIPGLLAGRRRALARCDELLSDMPREATLLGASAVLVRDPGPLAGKRVALMASWDPDGLLDPYVRHYIAHLQELGFVVVLATERPLDLSPEGAPGMPDGVTRRDCTGYDFTSWKAAFELLPQLYEASELLLCNDSVFAPVGTLRPLFGGMEGILCDFWGLAESIQHKPHLPSYFIMLRRRALDSRALRDFFARVDTNPAARHAIGHELNFSLWLARNGLIPGSALPQAVHGLTESLAHHAWRPCLLAGLPLLKRNLLADNPLGQDLRAAPQTLRELGYPLDLLQAYFERRGIFTGLHFGPRLPLREGGVSVVMLLEPNTDEAALAAALSALAGQSLPDWELVAAHAGEAPPALAAFAERDVRVRLVPLPKDTQGLPGWRFALAHARRQVLAFLDLADPGAALPPQALELRLAALEDGSGVAVSCTMDPGLYDAFPALLTEDALPGLSGLMLRKEWLHGLDWNAPEGARPAWWICAQLCLDGPFARVDDGGACAAHDAAAPTAEQVQALGAALVERAGHAHDLRALLRLLRAGLSDRAAGRAGNTPWRRLKP